MRKETTTDLKPGDLVRHPTRLLNGLVRRSRVNRDEVVIMRLEENIDSISDYDLTGWERVETVRPGHVQVRVDDLELGPDMGDSEEDFVARWQSEFPEYGKADLRLIYRAITAQRAESTQPDDEKPTSATVTLPCPDCGEAITRTAQVWTDSQRDRGLTWATHGWHTCPPAQPDEPTEFGARIVVTLPDGTREKWLRQVDGWWVNEYGTLSKWAHLIESGTVTLGWDE